MNVYGFGNLIVVLSLIGIALIAIVIELDKIANFLQLIAVK